MPHSRSSPLLAATQPRQAGGTPKPLERGAGGKDKPSPGGGKPRVKFAPNASC